MKVSEYLASIVVEVVVSSTEGKPLRWCFDVLEDARKWLPYDAQLDAHASSPYELQFVASVPYDGASLTCQVVVRPSFLGLDVTVVGIEDAELRRRVAMDFFAALDKDVKTEDDC